MLLKNLVTAISIMLLAPLSIGNYGLAHADKENNNSEDEENTIACGEPLTIITKKNRAAEIPPVSRFIVNDRLERFQCTENEGKEDKINLKEGDKVRVIAHFERLQLQADGIFLFEKESFFTDRVFVTDKERISDQEIKFKVPEDVDKDIDSIKFDGLVRGDEDDRIEYMTHNLKVRR